MIQRQQERREKPIDIRPELLIQVSGLVASETAMENKFGQMGLATREIGRTIERRVSANLLILMETFMKVTGSMTRPMAEECTFM